MSNISIFLDTILREFAISSKSYVQDTTDFLNKISVLQVPNDAILASFDVISLYTSINHKRGLEAVRRKLETMKLSLEAKEFVLELLSTNLTCNYFSFNNKYHMQIRGTAMGANAAPAYANIFVAVLEESIVLAKVHR